MRKPMAKSKKIEKFIQVTVDGLVIIGLVLIFGKKSWWPSFYQPVYFGLTFLTSAALIILSQFIFKAPDSRRQEAIMFFRFGLTAALALNALGELCFYPLYRYGIEYDKMIHFANSFLFVAALTSFYEKWHNLNLGRALKIAAIVVFVGGLLWEVFEFSSDLFFKTSVFGVYGQFRGADTIFDVASDLLGLTAGLIFVSWRGWRNLFNKLIGYRRGPALSKILTAGSCSPNLAAK